MESNLKLVLAFVIAATFFSAGCTSDLLGALFAIAEDGEDEGDAPWAAANTISEFAATMLTPYRHV